uniref:BLVR domain-containing protein n=1 Tax=Strongyloides venezuelensis TaxID=75913 RepID=A0A0K0FVR9_STRVS
MSHGTISSMANSITTELPDILKNLLSVLQNEAAASNEYLVEIEVNIKKKDAQNNNYGYDVAVTDVSTKKKKSKKKEKIKNSILSKKKNKNRKNKKKKKAEDISENSTFCKTMKSRYYDENSDDDIMDSDDRYPDESLENLPYLNESERQLLKALRREQTKKSNKKEKPLVNKHHIALPWDIEEEFETSTNQSKSTSTAKTSSFSHHYPYVPRKSNKINEIKAHKKVDVKENNAKKEKLKPISPKKQKNKERCHYVDAMDVIEENDVEKDSKINEDITKDMRKIFE